MDKKYNDDKYEIRDEEDIKIPARFNKSKPINPSGVIGPDGNPIPGRSLDFETVGEHWITIKVEDGSIVKMKIVIVGVTRMADISGEPVYAVSNQNLLRVIQKTEEPFVL